MATAIAGHKNAAVNPLKSSQPLGAAYALLGIENAMPLFHGSQGCTSFALVLLVRHFKETIPLQTTAMDEVATILGGADHLEEAILNLKKRTNPSLIGICTTALVETRGEDFAGDIVAIKARCADSIAGTEIVFASTPDFDGSMEDGWAKAVTSVIDGVVQRPVKRRVDPAKIVILPGSHLTVGDVELLRDTAEAFGLSPVVLPDIALALDGTVPGRWIPTSYGGTSIAAIKALSSAAHCFAIGEHMRGPAEALESRAQVPFTVFDTLTGLRPTDRFIAALAEVSGRPVPARIRRARSRLQDAMLDGHFHFSGKRVGIAAEPDHLFALAAFFQGLGATVGVAVTTCGGSPALAHVPVDNVRVGDLQDLEDEAGGCDLLVTHSHGRQAADKLGIPLMRVGFPVFDRLGAQYRRNVLYDGTRELIFEAANIFQASQAMPTPEMFTQTSNSITRDKSYGSDTAIARH